MTQPPRETPDIQTSTDQYARRFDGAVGRWLLDVQWGAVYSLLHECPGRRVLELGGGHAQITGQLLEHGYDVSVLSSSSACADRLKPFLQHPNCAFRVGDLLSLPYEDQSFDAVIALRLMAHLDDWNRLLAEATRVARHTIIIEFPTPHSINIIQKFLFPLKKAMEEQTREFRCFTDKMIIDACRPQGYEPTGRQRQFFWPMALHRVMKMPRFSRTLEASSRTLGLTHILGSPVILRLTRIGEASGE